MHLDLRCHLVLTFHYLMWYYNLWSLEGTQLVSVLYLSFWKGLYLDPFLFIFVHLKHKFYRKNCRRQWDSNSDHRKRRQACWPLDHHHHSSHSSGQVFTQIIKPNTNLTRCTIPPSSFRWMRGSRKTSSDGPAKNSRLDCSSSFHNC